MRVQRSAKPIVELLDETRLRVSNTAVFPIVVEAVEYIDAIIAKHCPKED